MARLPVLVGLLLCSVPLLAQGRAQVMGTVKDARTGATVYCPVELQSPDGRLLALTNVNSEGSYSLFVPLGTPFLLVVKEENGYADTTFAVDPMAPGTTNFVLDLLLRPRDP